MSKWRQNYNSNETCTKSETWQLTMNHDQNNGAIHIYLKFYIWGIIETLGDFGPIVYAQNPRGPILSPKCKFSDKFELYHYSDQYSYVIANFHVLCMFHCRVLFFGAIFYPTVPRGSLSIQGIILTENDYPHHVQRSEKYPDANF